MAADPQANTVQLEDGYLESVTYHNREYQSHALSNQIYFAPIDEDETERLRIQHDVLSRCFDGRLVFPPLTRLRRILDCGYGTASWAMEVAEQNPRCEKPSCVRLIRVNLRENPYSDLFTTSASTTGGKVIGVDINPTMQPDEIPENLYLQVDDLNRRFTWQTNYFDLVHSQNMAAGIHVNRWPRYLRDMYHTIRPGGWCQLVEIHFNVQSDNGTLTDGHALRQWSATYLESLSDVKNLRAPLRLREMLTSAGFVDIENRVIPLPTCGWPTEPRERNIGIVNRDNVQRLLSSMALYPFVERLGMPLQDAQLLIANARHEADNPAFKVYVAYV
ncbi:UMTA methyltransferase [Phlyctema vagabunda]|uniref:UMTA methyltransferase n=1 Tax=Phlyctema vagabunda TaxID=108571 RepID=A0ABR4P4N0_9HELO